MLRYVLLLANRAKLFPVKFGKGEEASPPVVGPPTIGGGQIHFLHLSGQLSGPTPVRTCPVVQNDRRADRIQSFNAKVSTALTTSGFGGFKIPLSSRWMTTRILRGRISRVPRLTTMGEPAASIAGPANNGCRNLARGGPLTTAGSAG